jgi:hypothetical protein
LQDAFRGFDRPHGIPYVERNFRSCCTSANPEALLQARTE